MEAKHNVITFEKLSRFPRPREPCAVALPFPAGFLRDPEAFRLFDTDGCLPVQAAATARWPDGSVRWLHADVLVDLPPNAAKTLHWRVAPDMPAPAPAFPVCFDVRDGAVIVDSGAARLVLNATPDAPLFGALECGAFRLGAGALGAPEWVDPEGRHWQARAGASGWRVIRPGPVHGVVELDGMHHGPDDAQCLAFRLRVHAFAGKPWFQVDYRITHLERAPSISLRSIGFAIRPPAGTAPAHLALAVSNYVSAIRRSTDGTPLTRTIDAAYLLGESNEQTPETLYGTFWADWTRPGVGGLCVTLFQAHQNIPKALTVHNEGIDVGLFPAGGESGLTWPRGVARTQRWLLHAHAGEPDTEALDARSLQFQMPDRPVVPRAQYIQAEVFEPALKPSSVPGTEAFLIDCADKRVRAYGLLHWGDAPDDGYTHQGRGGGELVWTNNEYDLPHAAMLLFVRTGERRFLDYLLVAGEHLMDVDICRGDDDPLREGGQVTHSARHVSGAVTPSHEWVEGLLDLYHVTADPTARETAVGIGENLLRHLQRPNFLEPASTNARQTGWALRSLVALYRETGEERWLTPARAIVEQFALWRERHGAWLSSYTSHTLIRIPFMIAIAGNSLMRYYWLTRDARTADLIVSAARDLLENALQADGRFYYKELPSLQHRGAGLYVLELLAYAYDLTGEAVFVEAGLPAFNELLAAPRGGSGRKRVVDDAVIWEKGASPKHFASVFMPTAMFARVMDAAGLAGDSPEGRNMKGLQNGFGEEIKAKD